MLNNWLNVPLLPQHSPTDCLPACVEMVLTFWGKSVKRVWIEQILESTEFGTPGFKTLNLQYHGYSVIYAPATDERPLRQALNANKPPIVLVMTDALPYWAEQTAHAVVVIGMSDTEILLNDPTFPTISQIVPYSAFMLAWSEFDYLYTIICPKELR